MSQVVEQTSVGEELKQGRQAASRNAWHEAYEMLNQASVIAPLSAEDLSILAESAWWTGRLEESIAARELAYTSFLDQKQQGKAARLAVSLAIDHFGKLAPAMAAGWLSRAERLLETLPEGPEYGHLIFARTFAAFHKGEYDLVLELTPKLIDIGSRFADRDLQAFGLLFQGRALVAKGQVDEGLALLDEATVAAVSGELGPLATGVTYCMAISSTTVLQDYRRAGEWTEAAGRWCDRQSISGFPGICRVHRAQIMHLRGSWAEAERDVRLALKELSDFNLATAGEGFYELGEIRMRMGDLKAAEEAFHQAEELGREPYPGVAVLHLEQGNAPSAAAEIRRALDEEQRGPLHRFAMLGPQVQMALVLDDLKTAKRAVAEMEEICANFRTPALEAGAAYAGGTLQVAQGGGPLAVGSLRRALKLWKQAGVPYEAARTRVALARAYRLEGDEEAALIELKNASASFQRLGAALEVQKTNELIGPEAASGRLSATRVVRAFMFTDIVGSTKLVEALGDDSWGHLLQWHDKTLRGLFLSHAGEEVKHAGDGFFVAFEGPQDALSCAVAIQRTLDDHRKIHGFSPQVRIGVHCGDATKNGRDYEGKEVHAAARIGGLADAGEILASGGLFSAVEGQFKSAGTRAVELKGIEKPMEIVTVIWT